MYSSLLLMCLVLPAQTDAALGSDARSSNEERATNAQRKEARPTGAASGSEKVDLAAETRRLVRQLNANSAADREAAEAALVALGSDVLVHLPPISPRTPAEVKERLGRVRSALETDIALAAADPTYVTLKGEMSLAEALASLEEQTGNRIAESDQRSGMVTVDFDKVLYWQALDNILDQVGLAIEEYGGESGAIVLRSKVDGEGSRSESATYSGVFRFEPIRFESRRDLRNPEANSLLLTVSISWEPRVKPISIRLALDSLQVKDDQGNSLSVGSERPALTSSTESGVSAVEMVLRFELPSREVKQIESLQGKMTAMVTGSVQTFKFDQLKTARDVELRNAGVTVTLERVRKNVDLFDVYAYIAYDEASNALESHRGWLFDNDAYMLDAAGARIANVGLRETRREENAAGVAILFDVKKGLEGCSFVYKTPALILNIPVDYELKSILLP